MMHEVKLPEIKLAADPVSYELKAEYDVNGLKIGVDWNCLEELYKECGHSSCICANTAEDSICCSKSREAELAEELKEKDAEIERLKHVARKLEDDVRFEQMVRDALARDCAAAVELADSLKKKIEYCKKNGIWAEEDESQQVQ